MNKKEQKQVKETIADLVRLLGIDGDFDCSFQEDSVDVVLTTNDSGIVIGYHGEVLESLGLVSSLCVSNSIGRFVRVSVDVGDYKKNRTEFLKNLALQAKERAILEQKEIPLPLLRSWERRVVHLLLQEDKEVVTESIGAGRDRTLVIKPQVLK